MLGMNISHPSLNISNLAEEGVKIYWGPEMSTLQGILGQHHTKWETTLQRTKNTTQESNLAGIRSELRLGLAGNKTLCWIYANYWECEPTTQLGRWLQTQLGKLIIHWGGKSDQTNRLGKNNNAPHIRAHLFSYCCWYSLRTWLLFKVIAFILLRKNIFILLFKNLKIIIIKIQFYLAEK